MKIGSTSHRSVKCANEQSFMVKTIELVKKLRDGKFSNCRNKRISSATGAEFTNDLWETLTYGELLKQKVYLIWKTFRWVSYFNNFIKGIYNRARCILIPNFLELGKIHVSKVHRKSRSPVNLLRICSQNIKYCL